MTKHEAEQTARLMQQYHDAFVFLAHSLITGSRQRTIAAVLASVNIGQNPALSVLGFSAMAFIYAQESVAKPLGCGSEIITPRNLTALHVTTNTIRNCDGNDNRAACLRHLRNCFGHGRYDLTKKRTTVYVELRDFERQGGNEVETFRGNCTLQQIVRIAERTLIKAHRIVAREALK